MLPLTNLFRKEKQEKIEITTSKSQIVAEARAKAEELLKRIGLEDKQMYILLPYPVVRNSELPLSVRLL